MRKKFTLLLLLLFSPLWAATPAVGPSISIVAASYYDYPAEEIEKLQLLDTDLLITKESLQKWDRLLAELIKNHHILESDLYRLYAYLYTAQRDAAILSYDTKGSYKGSLDPISLAIMQLFYPYFSPTFKIEGDEYSHRLAQMVFPNFKKRFLRESNNIKKEDRLLKMFNWTGQYEGFGESILGWTPWVLSPIASITIPPPPANEDQEAWNKQLQEIREIQKKGRSSLHITKKQYTHANMENWMMITNHFLYSHDIPFATMLISRSILAIALYDAIIANTKLKYIYDVDQPSLKDSSIKSMRTIPYYPSYPSLHTTLAYTAAAILTYFFPEEEARWKEEAEKAAQARIAEGINYPIDVEIGELLGKKISKKFIDK